MATAKKRSSPSQSRTTPLTRRSRTGNKASTPIKRKTSTVKPKANPDSYKARIEAMRAVYGNTRVTILDVPWEQRDVARVLGAEWAERIKSYVYTGDLIPAELKPFISKDYSYARWMEDEINKRIKAVEPPAGGMYIPREHQQVAIDDIKSAVQKGWRAYLEADGTGIGKGLSASTIIPTPRGYVLLDQISAGDYVIGLDGQPARVIEKRLSRARSFYRINFTNGAHVKADSDHRWKVKVQGMPRNTLELPEDEYLRILARLRHLQKSRLAVCAEELLALTNTPEAFREAVITPTTPINPNSGNIALYHPQELLERFTGLNEEYQVYTTAELAKILEENPKAHLEFPPVKPYKCAKKNFPAYYNLTPYQVGRWAAMHHSDRNNPISYAQDVRVQRILTELNTRNKLNKENLLTIPHVYINASHPQLIELLTGLMDESGFLTHSSDGKTQAVFSHTNLHLFSQVYELIMRLSLDNTIERVVINDEIHYRISFYPQEQVFQESDENREALAEWLTRSATQWAYRIRSIEKRSPTEAHYCISVENDDHMYLCTESNIPTHNSISGLLGVSEGATVKGFTRAKKAKLLILCPNNAVAHWRNTLRHVDIPHLRVMVLNYEQYKKLLTVPAGAANAKKTKTKNKHIASAGQPLINWDFIIVDESQKVKNATSQRTQALQRIAKYSALPEKAPFVVYMSATIGQQLLELGYLAPLIGQAVKKPLTMDEWPAWLASNGFHVEKKGSEWQWVKVAGPGDTIGKQKQKQDIDRLAKLLFNPSAPSIRRKATDIAGWPEQQLIAQPVSLSDMSWVAYQKLWTEFRKEMQLKPKGKDPDSALIAALRLSQKASFLRTQQTVEEIMDQLDNGYQVAVSVRFLESLDEIKRQLEKIGLTVSEYSGRPHVNNEQERLKFQKGTNKVILFTVEEAVSFHAKEQLPDGTLATPYPRATLVHDLRYSAISLTQIAGRAHRDGQNSNVYFLYAENTVEQHMLNIMLNKMKNMNALMGDTLTEAEELVDMLDAILQ